MIAKRTSARSLILFSSFLLIPVTLNYFSPVLIITAGFEGIVGGAFFIWTGVFATSLFFGRAFCAYLCPYGGLQMVVHLIASKQLKKIGCLRIIKYVFGIAWIVMILYTLARGLHTVDFFYLTESAVSMDHFHSVFLCLIIFAVIFILYLVLGKRGTCHYLCLMSVLNIAGPASGSKLGKL